VDNAKA